MVLAMRRASLALFLAGILVLGGCGGDDTPTASDAPAVDVPVDGDDPTAVTTDSEEAGGTLVPEPVPSPYSEALAASLNEAGALDAELVNCVAMHLVAAAGGPEAVEAAGLGAGEFAQIDSYAEAGLPATNDTVVRVQRAFTNCNTTAFALLARAAGIPDPQIECMTTITDVESASELLSRRLVQGDAAVGDAPDAIQSALEACGSENG